MNAINNAMSASSTTNNVASNDTGFASATDLDAIVAERKAWEIGAYRTSNQQLYAILAKCLSYFMLLSASKKKTDALRVSYDAFVTANNIKFKDSTNLINRVVKCAFYEASLDRNAQRDRRRISAYALVLRRAVEDQIAPVDLPAWIDENGGIEQVRLSRGNAVSPATKAQVARESVEASESYIAVIENTQLMQSFDATDFDKTFVAVIVPRGDGKVEIRAVVKSAAAINASLATLYSQVAANSTTPVVSNDKVAA
jgi:hypothetical protein